MKGIDMKLLAIIICFGAAILSTNVEARREHANGKDLVIDPPGGGDGDESAVPVMCKENGYIKHPNPAFAEKYFYCRKIGDVFYATPQKCPEGQIFQDSNKMCATSTSSSSPAY